MRITEEPDIGVFRNRLNQMSETGRDAIFKKFADQMDTAAAANTQEGMVNHFRKSREAFVSLEFSTGNLFCTSSSHNTKPRAAGRVPGLDNLHPLLVKDLSLGATHRGRYLCGTVAVDDAFCTRSSTVFLLEDISGMLVDVSIYNIPNSSTITVSKMFPKGRHLAILEPFFKQRMDMTKGIRVEDPREVVEWQIPTECLEWKTLGNQFMHSRPPNPEGAVLCYEAALERVPESFLTAKKELAVILTNLAICNRKSKEFPSAVRYAAVASRIDPSNAKAWYLLASSLLDMGISFGLRDACSSAGFIVESSRLSSSPFQDFKAEFEHLAVTIRREQRSLDSIDSKSDIPNALVKAFAGESTWGVIPGIVEWSNLDGRPNSQKNSDVPLCDSWSTASAYFRDGKFTDAESLYNRAIFDSKEFMSVMSSMAVILSNRAAALIMKESIGLAQRVDLQAALIDSCVSSLLNRNNWKPWIRQTHVIEKAVGTKDALKHAQRILSSIEKSHEETTESRQVSEILSIEIDKLGKQLVARTTVTPISNVSTEQQLRERDADLKPAAGPSCQGEEVSNEESIDEYISRVEQAMMMREGMIAANPRASNGRTPKSIFGPLCTRRCPKIHVEFPKAEGWPGGIDSVLAYKILYKGYLDAQLQPWFIAMLLREGAFPFTSSQLFKRWGGDAALLEMAQRDQVWPGDIIDCRPRRLEIGIKYDNRIRSNFVNTPSRTQKLYFGGTHVSVGFNDLGCLLSAEFEEPQEIEKHKEPLRFIGFERSEFSIAKFSVILNMIKDSSIPLGHVIQVWYSSTWSRNAFQSFLSSVASVLNSTPEPKSDSEHKVDSYLKNWMAFEPVSATVARQKWFHMKMRNSPGRDISDACSFRHEKDRLALCKYFLTGELVFPERNSPTRLENSEKTDRRRGNRKKKAAIDGENQNSTGEEASVGSLTMWSVPDGSPPLEDESIFNTILLEDVLEEQMTASSNSTIVDLFVMRTMRQLGRVRQHLIDNRLNIELYHGIVKPLYKEGGLEIIREIAAQKPDSMSWSNVLDYMELEDFHDVARSCSTAGNTVHYGYSMNWSTEVFGINIMDYPDQIETSSSSRKRIIDISLGRQMTKRAKESGMDALLTVPFFDTPLNLTMNHLARKYYTKWTKHFAKKAASTLERRRRNDMGWPITITEKNSGWLFDNGALLLENPLYRNSTTVHMTWSYDSSLDMLPSL